jgi:hypothetical protein
MANRELMEIMVSNFVMTGASGIQDDLGFEVPVDNTF